MLNKLIALVSSNTPNEALIQKKLRNGAQIIDVRSEGEYAERHIEGALNVPLARLEQYARETADRSQPLLVHCAAGVRAKKAVQWLEAQGFSDVSNAGGLEHLLPLIADGK